ncbi:MAG: hypothetical protein WCS92_05005, partial [Candidatus Babeliales bacterium]
SSSLATLIIEKNSSPEILSWAMGIAEKLILHGYYSPSAELAKSIVEKSSNPEILSRAMSIAEKFVNSFSPTCICKDAIHLTKTIVKKNPEPEILERAYKLLPNLRPKPTV